MRLLLLISLASSAFLASNCTHYNSIKETTQFSRLDSLTDTYLVLHDSLLQSWNRIVKNEIDKTRTLHQLIEVLEASAELDKAQLESFRSRLLQLDRIRFTQKTLANPHVVEEYDKACWTLTNELISLASFSNHLSSIMQLLEDEQRSSYFHRYQYDSLANQFNEFITINGSSLAELDNSGQLEKKPLFWQVASNR